MLGCRLTNDICAHLQYLSVEEHYYLKKDVRMQTNKWHMCTLTMCATIKWIYLEKKSLVWVTCVDISANCQCDCTTSIGFWFGMQLFQFVCKPNQQKKNFQLVSIRFKKKMPHSHTAVSCACTRHKKTTSL